MFLCRTSYSSGCDYDSYQEDNTDSFESSSEVEVDSDIQMCTCNLPASIKVNPFDDSLDSHNLFTVFVGVEEADPVCIKIQDLLRRGKLSKDKIFYKYLNDVLEIMYNPFHQYDQEVVEFFNTITYLGGKRTACFIRGPMNVGDGRNSHVSCLSEKKMNLGGPSETVCAKHQAGYTPESGVIKPLSLGHMALLKNSKAERLIETSKLSVIPCALANDGTALKPTIEFDPRLKDNMGLTKPVDLNFIQTNPTPSSDYLKDNIVTEAIVSSLTSLDNLCSLPVAVDYTAKCGKTGEAMATLFEQQIKTLQACESCQQRAPDNRHIFSSAEINCSSFCEECYESKSVCDECKLKGQLGYLPSLGICDLCNDKNAKRFRRIVTVVCTDCESGKKVLLKFLKSNLNREP